MLKCRERFPLVEMTKKIEKMMMTKIKNVLLFFSPFFIVIVVRFSISVPHPPRSTNKGNNLLRITTSQLIGIQKCYTPAKLT